MHCQRWTTYMTIAFACAASRAHASPYAITSLGADFFPRDLNESGEIVGGPFLYADGTLTDLGVGTLLDINNSGQIIGASAACGTPFGGFILEGGTLTCIGALAEGGYSHPERINDLGQVVGSDLGVFHAFIWQGGAFTSLTPGPASSFGWDINNAGQAVGSFGLWQNGSIVSDLGIVAMAINDIGQIIGRSGGTLAIWDDGVVTPLGFDGQGKDINNAGQVVGLYNGFNPFLWADGVFADLNDLMPPDSGWQLVMAQGINDQGQIAGWGFLNGQGRAFLMTPIPEPATACLLAFGGVWAFRRRRSHRNRRGP